MSHMSSGSPHYSHGEEESQRARRSLEQLLLSQENNPNAIDEQGWTALQIAAYHGLEAETLLLLESGARVNMWHDWAPSALHLAAIEGHEVVARPLLEYGADVDGNAEFTPLHYACEGGHESLVRLLLEHEARADMASQTESQNTPLHFAAGRGHLGIVKLLLNNGANIHAKGKCTEFARVAITGDRAKTSPLVDCSSERSPEMPTEMLPDMLQKKSPEKSQTMLLEGPPPRFLIITMPWTCEGGQTALHMAAVHGNAATVRQLLDSGANIHQKDSFGRTALHWGCVRIEREQSQHNEKATVRLVFTRGSDIDAYSKDDRSESQEATNQGNEAKLQQPPIKELNMGVKVLITCEEEPTAQYLATILDDDATLRQILDNQGYEHEKDESGRTVINLTWARVQRQEDDEEGIAIIQLLY